MGHQNAETSAGMTGVAIIISMIALITLRWSSQTELSYYSPFVYSAWGVMIWYFAPAKRSLWMLLTSAVILRIGCVGAELVWSDDAYRYLWEGKTVLNGQNPFSTPPESFTVQDGIREYVNHPTIPSVYPPLAQVWFALQAWIWYNSSMPQIAGALLDIGTLIAIWVWLKRHNRSVQGAWMYALHPLPIIECSWSGHLESLALFCLAWGLVGYDRWGKWVWFFGGWVKLLPFLLLSFSRHWRWRSICFMVLGSLFIVWPFWEPSALQGLQTYAAHWSYNASIFSLLSLWSPTFARLICILIAGMAGLFVWWNWFQLRLGIDRAILLVGIIFVICSPTVHPWYALWVMIPMLMVKDDQTCIVWGLWCSLIPLTYVSIFTLNPLTGEWSPPLWPTLISYLVPLAIWLSFQYKKVVD